MRFAPLLLAALCALVLFTGLDGNGFLDWREARDAEVAREVIGQREGLTPLFGIEPLLEKPLPAYAPEALVHLFTRPLPLRSRQARAALALLLLLVTGSIGARHFGARAGVIAAGVLASALALPLAARTDGTQILAAIFAWVGCAALADAQFGRAAGRDLRLVVGYGALAAALVCAGPLPALWPLGGLGLYLALARPEAGWTRVRPLAGLVMMLGVALPWYAAMTERYGAAFLTRAPFFPYGLESRGPWYAGPVLAVSFLVVGFFPWSALLPGALAHAATWWRTGMRLPLPGAARPRGDALPGDPLSRERREEGVAHFFIACLFAALAPIVAYPAPPMTAVLPALPAAALLCARFLDHLFEDATRVARPLTQAVRMLALIGTVGAVLLSLVATRVRDITPELRLLASVVFVTSWLPFLADFLGRRRLAAGLLALPVAFGTPVVAMRLLPAMEDYLSARSVAVAMAAVSPPVAPLLLVDPAPPTLRLYTERNLVPPGNLRTGFTRFRASDGHAYVAFRPVREKAVLHAAPGPLEILLRTPSLVLARVQPE